ncbi:putative NAD dependent epimerase/dehydratase [Colletotrichum sublineola]|uniref:Putative NAD dependent epimerase/dehydratase n=1 Tax=Colletotrichum sublineola TaxID=1173701 RepID=A0A066X335_COLSU|nr:putative NAD dependent epimerase/dehydratase [Colletotrichum sublineola]
MTPEKQYAIPMGATVLVTGANGFIGSHVCNELLQLGFNVRGSVRDVERCMCLPKALESQNPKGKFMLVSLPDMEKEGAFDSLVEGVSAVIHIASPFSFSSNPECVIPSSVNAAINALKAANKSQSVKRFVFTSSAVAAALPKPNMRGIVVTADSWNTHSVGIAWREAPCHPQRAWHVYAASKVEAETAVWKFNYENIRRRQPRPSFHIIIHRESLEWDTLGSAFIYPPAEEYFVDVQDTAGLHVAGAVLPNVRNERIFALAETFNFDTVLEILRKQFPGKDFVDDFHHYQETSTASELRSRASDLLRQLGRDGFVSLEQSVLLNIEDQTMAQP